MLLFCDSFDHYDTTHLPEKYTAVSGATITTGGRGGGNCLYTGGSYVQQSFANANELIIGFALNPVFIANNRLIEFFDSSTIQLAIFMNNAGGIDVYAYPSGTIVASTTADLSAGTYQYVEVKALFSPTATGSVSVQVNGSNIINVTGIVLSGSGNAWANTIAIGTSSYQAQIDDLYICDGTGTINNDFLGDVAVQLLLPNGDGAINDFSQVGGTSGQNYTSVNEVPPDDDTSYVYSSTVGDIDAYTLASIGSPSAVIGVQITASARKDDSSTRVVALGFGNASTQVFDTGFSLTSNYEMFYEPYDQNPITSADWAVSDFSTAQIALKVIS
jgi:hypothetical protein